MIRKFLIFIALFTLGLSAQAQYFSYGGKLGLSFPGFQDERIASQRITPTVSFTGAFNFNKSILLQAELGYERKGNKFTNQYWDDMGELVADSTYDVRTNLDYVTVPLFLKLNLGRSNKFYFQAGAYYGYLLRARYSGMKLGEMVSKENIYEGLSLTDYGFVVGGGLETPIRRELSLLLDVKYNHGLKDLNLDPSVIGSSNPLKNKSFIKYSVSSIFHMPPVRFRP